LIVGCIFLLLEYFRNLYITYEYRTTLPNIIGNIELVSDSCLTATQKKFSYIMARTS